MKYVDVRIVFQEVPDEITLAINISGCTCHCEGCHSPYLAEDIGEVLDCEALDNLIKENLGITCICFMGGDASPSNINRLAEYVRANYPKLKTAWYSGREHIADEIKLSNFDYLKFGPYKKELGPLNSRTTNQRFYRVQHISYINAGSGEWDSSHLMVDITSKFWRNENSSM